MIIIVTFSNKIQRGMTVKAFSHTAEGRLFYTLIDGTIGFIDGVICVTCKM